MLVHGSRRYAVAPAGQDVLPTASNCHAAAMTANSITASTAWGRKSQVQGSDAAVDLEAQLEREAIRLEVAQ
jgi:hypothetical protein